MVMAVVMINVDETSRVASQISELPGISEVYSVAGRYDPVSIMPVKGNESVADLSSSDHSAQYVVLKQEVVAECSQGVQRGNDHQRIRKILVQ